MLYQRSRSSSPSACNFLSTCYWINLYLSTLFLFTQSYLSPANLYPSFKTWAKYLLNCKKKKKSSFLRDWASLHFELLRKFVGHCLITTLAIRSIDWWLCKQALDSMRAEAGPSFCPLSPSRMPSTELSQQCEWASVSSGKSLVHIAMSGNWSLRQIFCRET